MEDAVGVVIRKSLLKVCSFKKLALLLPAGSGANNDGDLWILQRKHMASINH
jgi:hypothetical protein